MRLSDLLKKKNQKVVVRVPAKRQEEFGGAEVRGTVTGVVPGGGSVTWVEVKISRRGTFQFRPQDLTLA
jgi:hypothetical protein